jgi:hypothetical protein
MRVQNVFYNLALNPVMRRLLRSRFHRMASGNLGLLCYRGRQSGRPFETPLSYVRGGNAVRFLSSHDTRWWRNFRDEDTPVEVEIAGTKHPGTARLFECDSEALRTGVREFLTALPRDAMVYGIKLDADRKPRESDIESAARRLILVEVELTPIAP